MRIHWDEESLDDFENLKTLLDECRKIEDANNVIARLRKIVDMAEDLSRPKYKGNYGSLMNQLDDDWSIELRRLSEERQKAPTP